MKELFDMISRKSSKMTTVMYSTSFSLGIRFFSKRFHDPIYGIYGFVRFADEIVDSFDFNYNVRDKNDTVHVWRSVNPVNGLEYGYGGVKLLPRLLTLKLDINNVDMTMSISDKFKVHDTVSNITRFNTDPFNSWKSAFRECCKLATIGDAEALIRLNRWCVVGSDLDAIAGAIAGKKYGQENASNKEALLKINDFTWLQDRWSSEKFQQ